MRLQNIEKGMRALRTLISDNKIKSISIPALGCGKDNNSLNWEDVHPVIYRGLSGTGITAHIFNPRSRAYKATFQYHPEFSYEKFLKTAQVYLVKSSLSNMSNAKLKELGMSQYVPTDDYLKTLDHSFRMYAKQAPDMETLFNLEDEIFKSSFIKYKEKIIPISGEAKKALEEILQSELSYRNEKICRLGYSKNAVEYDDYENVSDDILFVNEYALKDNREEFESLGLDKESHNRLALHQTTADFFKSRNYAENMLPAINEPEHDGLLCDKYTRMMSGKDVLKIIVDGRGVKNSDYRYIKEELDRQIGEHKDKVELLVTYDLDDSEFDLEHLAPESSYVASCSYPSFRLAEQYACENNIPVTKYFPKPEDVFGKFDDYSDVLRHSNNLRNIQIVSEADAAILFYPEMRSFNSLSRVALNNYIPTYSIDYFKQKLLEEFIDLEEAYESAVAQKSDSHIAMVFKSDQICYSNEKIALVRMPYESEYSNYIWKTKQDTTIEGNETFSLAILNISKDYQIERTPLLLNPNTGEPMKDKFGKNIYDYNNTEVVSISGTDLKKELTAWLSDEKRAMAREAKLNTIQKDKAKNIQQTKEERLAQRQKAKKSELCM